MKETPFGTTFMAFYCEDFIADKGMKSDIRVLKIIYQYDRDSRCFEIGGKRIQLTVENVALIFGQPINGAAFIVNKTCTLKDRSVIKLYFKNIKKIAKISSEEALDDLLMEKKKEN